MTHGLPRTYLYVPGDAADKLAKAVGRGADALIIDLEDAVPLAGKDAALAAVTAWLGEQGDAPVELWVRVNSGEPGDADVRALAGLEALTGLALAKADAAAVTRVAALLAEAGDERTLLMPVVESPAAVLELREIARSPRVQRLQVGEVDLAGELGVTLGPDETELLAIRSAVVLESAAAGIEPPVGPVSRLVRDLDAFAVSTRLVTRLGFVGRCCIHPGQVGVVHDVVTPSDEEAASAQRTLDALAASEAAGTAVLLDEEGRLVDPAVVRSAERTVAMHAAAAERS